MEKHFSRYLPWLLVLLCLGLRLPHITTFAIQHDEPFSIFTSNLAWSEFWQVFLNENNPPLHPILLKFVIETFGLSDFWMRFLSVALSSLAVFFIYKTADLLSGMKAGIIASLIFCFSNLQIVYAHQIRAYALLVFLSAVSIYLLIKLIKTDNKKTFILLGVVNALLLYTHFMGLVFVGLSGISLVIYFNQKTVFKNLMSAYWISILLFAPYLPIFLDRLLWVNGDTWAEPPTSMMSIYFTFWKFFNAPLNTILGILTLLTGVVFINRADKIKKEMILLLSMVVSTFVLLYFISLYLPIYVERYLIFIAPVLYLSIGIILSKAIQLVPTKTGWILTFIFPILFIATFKIKSDINQVKTDKWAIINSIKEDKTVVLSPAWNDVNYCYHTNKELYFVKSLAEFVKLRQKDYIFADYELVDTWKENATNRRVLVSINDNNKHAGFQKMLNDHFILVQQLSDELFEYKVK